LNEKLKSNPFNNIKCEKGVKSVDFLKEEEIERLKNISLPSPCYEKARDLFLFQCACGVAYIDMINLKKDDFKNEDGTYYLSKERQKTKIQFTTVILPFGVDILKKYNFELPKISNQKYNIYLKVVGDIIKLNFPLHSHIARHTFSTLLLNNGVRMEIVSKCIGHSNIKQTQHYAKVLNNTIFDEIKNSFKF
jgi:site-specific recombinase XerD